LKTNLIPGVKVAEFDKDLLRRFVGRDWRGQGANIRIGYLNEFGQLYRTFVVGSLDDLALVISISETMGMLFDPTTPEHPDCVYLSKMTA
jgi:hypothetical protein